MIFIKSKEGCVFPMVIWSEFRMGMSRDDDYREDASHFTQNMRVHFFRGNNLKILNIF